MTHDISYPVQKGGSVPGTKWAMHENLTTRLNLALKLRVRETIVTVHISIRSSAFFFVERHEEDPTSEDTGHYVS